jgi:decaprenyl-phosphate phosphoribosyltransferase
MTNSREVALEKPSWKSRLTAHIAISRLDHSIKNVFLIPGILMPLIWMKTPLTTTMCWRILLGTLAVTLVACSNYVLNEILDAPFDRFHPTKQFRPSALGLVSKRAAYGQWILMMLAGVLLSLQFPWQFTTSLMGLWVMGCIYNIPPVRSKDIPYVDVLSESINNPLRMLQGWYLVTTDLIPPISMLISYWMVGAYFMALKRFSEYRQLQNTELASRYRKSFSHYSEVSLLESVLFYGCAAMLFFGAFAMRYRMELILSFPLVALVMAIYFQLAFDPDSAVQNPEKLYREPKLLAAVVACVVVMALLLKWDLGFLGRVFVPTLP